jgi:predicted RNase H-like nuclease (RuvC/YqgF family)
MNEYKIVIIELALGIAKKAKRIKELKEDNERLDEENDRLIDDLAKARNYIEVLRNDLKELSKEFTKWKSQREKDELKQS